MELIPKTPPLRARQVEGTARQSYITKTFLSIQPVRYYSRPSLL